MGGTALTQATAVTAMLAKSYVFDDSESRRTTVTQSVTDNSNTLNISVQLVVVGMAKADRIKVANSIVSAALPAMSHALDDESSQDYASGVPMASIYDISLLSSGDPTMLASLRAATFGGINQEPC